MLRRNATVVLLLIFLVSPSATLAQQPAPSPTTPAAPPQQSTTPAKDPNDPIERIKDEGMNRSQVMQNLSYLTDVIGPRLTASPGMKRSNEWTRDQLTKWGLQNAHLEAWGPFGRGWSLKRFSAQVSEPLSIPLIAYPKAWSPGTTGPLTAELVYVDAKDDADLHRPNSASLSHRAARQPFLFQTRAARIISPSTPLACRDSSLFRMRSNTTRARTIRIRMCLIAFRQTT